MKKGFTMIEVAISVFVLGLVVVGLFGFITLTLKTTHETQRRFIALSLANERMETIRNLPYTDVGTIGGVPVGPILQEEEVIRNNSTYTVNTDIRYVDDVFDGTVTSSPPDLLNTDYKQARVEVSWESNLPSRTILLVTQITPQGIEGGDSLGTLVFQALDSAGVGVAGATVHLVNPTVSPAVDLTTFTNDEGQVVVPGLLLSAGTYQISVTKEGYTSEQTYDQTSTFTPDADHSHITAFEGQVTNKTFFIDTLSTLTINTVNDTGGAIGNVPYTLTGSKRIGTDNNGQPVYLFNHQDTTDGSGTFYYPTMTWDSYSFSIDGVATGYDIKETSMPLPLALSPGSNSTLDVVLVPHSEGNTLHVTVVDFSNQPIPNATVQVVGQEYNETLTTSVYGQAFFTPIDNVADYTLRVQGVGYQQALQQIHVEGSTRVQITMGT
jgi:prepilin-type N-terminal cleavage/methylation domain-containing protein